MPRPLTARLTISGGGAEMGEVPVSERRATMEAVMTSWRHEAERDTGANGVVTTETMRAEEERWRKIFPDMKRCTIVIPRLRLSALSALKEEEADWPTSQQEPDRWMQPMEDGGRRFIKKVEFKMEADHVPIYCQPSGTGVLRPCPGVTSDPAHLCSEGCTKDHHGDSNRTIHSEIEHNYCQSEDRLISRCEQKDGDCSRSEKNVPHIVFKKVETGQWELMTLQVKRKKKMEDTDGITVQRKKESQPAASADPGPASRPSQFKKRRASCRQCAACLRENCGTCAFCRDMRQFGGPSRLRQKCVFRRCMSMKRSKVLPEEQMNLTLPNSAQEPEETVTVATTGAPTQPGPWRRQTEEQVEQVEQVEQEEVAAERRRRKREKKEARKRRMRRRRRRKKEKRASKENKWTPLLLKETKEDTVSPQFPLIGGTEVMLPDGTHLQLCLTLDGSHFSPSMLGDSALSRPPCLPQDGSLLHVPTGLTFISAAPQQPKEEQEEVEISLYGTGAEEAADMTLSEGVGEEGRFCEVEVVLPESDEETLTCSPQPSDITDGDTETAAGVTAGSHTHKPPEFIPLAVGSFSLLGGGVCDDVTDGRGLLHLLRVSRRTVLPAHWVAVLADGPQLQLLQCSRLSSMVDTVVHIQPDHGFYVTVQQRPLPDTHRLYQTHTHRITHLSQLVSLLLELERLKVCRGPRVQASTARLPAPDCHLLVAPPLNTCLHCLLEDEEEEEEEEEE